MKRLSVIVLLIAGCQSGVGSPPPDEQPAGEVLEQPLPEEPEPEPPLPEPDSEPAPEPDPIVFVVPVPIPVPLPPLPLIDMDVLRLACSYISHQEIIVNLGVVNDHWWSGMTYAQRLALNATSCRFDAVCVACWDTIADFIYLVIHYR